MNIYRSSEQIRREENTSFIIAEYDDVVIEVMRRAAADDPEKAMLIAIDAAMIKATLLKRKGVL